MKTFLRDWNKLLSWQVLTEFPYEIAIEKFLKNVLEYRTSQEVKLDLLFHIFIESFVYQFQDPSMKRNISFASPEKPQVFQISSRNMNLQIRVFEELIVPQNTRWKQMIIILKSIKNWVLFKPVFKPCRRSHCDLVKTRKIYRPGVRSFVLIC